MKPHRAKDEMTKPVELSGNGGETVLTALPVSETVTFDKGAPPKGRPISRRTIMNYFVAAPLAIGAIGAAASSAALAVPAVAAIEAKTSGLDAVIGSHRRAVAAQQQLEKAYSQAFDDAGIEDVTVFGYMGARTGQPVLFRTVEGIEKWFNGPAAANYRQALVAELQRKRADHDAKYEAAGLVEIEQAIEAVGDVEFDAFTALMNYRPETVAEMKAKALYLIEVLQAEQYDRLESWGAELLASFAHIDPVNPTV